MSHHVVFFDGSHVHVIELGCHCMRVHVVSACMHWHVVVVHLFVFVLSSCVFSVCMKKLSFEEDEAENGYQNDTQENNVTKASKTDGARYVLEFEYTWILVTFVRYVQKTTSPICLNFKKQSRCSASLFVSTQKFVLSRF